MAILAQFRVQFPEFGGGVTDTLVSAFLAATYLELDQTVWGLINPVTTNPVGMTPTFGDQGHLYLTAHRLAVSPMGQAARTVYSPKERGYRRTTYGAEFEIMQRSITGGFRVA